MTDGRLDRMREILLRLASVPDEERADQLTRLCGNDDGLRDEIESLLAHEDAPLHPFPSRATEAGNREPGSTPEIIRFPPHQPGDRVAHYRLKQLLGQGGMGEVFLAEDTNLDREVAIKFLTHTQPNDPSVQVRFINEARAASSLDHPAIGTIHGIDRDEHGQLYIVMGYYPGGSVAQHLASGRLQAEEAIELAIQVCDGLAAAHAKGIVHRDLKPANLMLGQDHRVKIIDFGIAKLGDQMQLTTTGRSLGTIAYMSPEQIKGEPVDERSDIFSLGVTLYQMLSGHLPFAGDYEASILLRIAQGHPDSIRKHRRDLPKGLSRVLDRALAKHPSDRYATVADMRRDLESVLHGRSPHTLIASRGRLRRFMREHRSLRQTAIAVVCVAIVSGAAAWTGWFDGLLTNSVISLRHQTFLIYPDGSGDFPTIAGAVAAASHRDTILLANGVFTGSGNYGLDFEGKSLVLRSRSDQPDSCVLDCQGGEGERRRGIRFFSGEHRGTLLQGITIRNARWPSDGAAVSISASSPTIRNCIFEDNHVGVGGGFGSAGAMGIIAGSDPLIEDCLFRRNRATNAGGAITCGGSTGIIANCFFEDNFAVHGGGAIQFYEASTTIENCVFRDNDCSRWSNDLFFDRPASRGKVVGCTLWGGQGPAEAVRARAGASPTFERCLIAFNPMGPAVAIEDAAVTLRCCNLYGNAGGDWGAGIADQLGRHGNIRSDPLFCNLVDGAPTLHAESPCLPRNNACRALIGAAGEGCTGRRRLEVPGRFSDIATALATATVGDTVVVAKGSYSVSNLDFPSGVTLLGATGRPEDVVLDAESDGRIFVCEHLEHGARIEAVTLAGGNVAGIYPASVGGAVACFDSDLELRDCIVTRCEAESGGGVYLSGPARATFVDVAFRENHGRHRAGALFSAHKADVLMEWCTFSGNFSLHQAGAVRFLDSQVQMIGCAFTRNAARSGAAVAAVSSTCDLFECLVWANSSRNSPLGPLGSGGPRGGIINYEGASGRLCGCTISQNLCQEVAGVIGAYQSTLYVERAIVAGNGGGRAMAAMDVGHITLQHCNLFGNPGGDFVRSLSAQIGQRGNFSSDPLFVDPSAGDFRLLPGSPCVADSAEGRPRIGVFPSCAEMTEPAPSVKSTPKSTPSKQ